MRAGLDSGGAWVLVSNSAGGGSILRNIVMGMGVAGGTSGDLARGVVVAGRNVSLESRGIGDGSNSLRGGPGLDMGTVRKATRHVVADMAAVAALASAKAGRTCDGSSHTRAGLESGGIGSTRPGLPRHDIIASAWIHGGFCDIALVVVVHTLMLRLVLRLATGPGLVRVVLAGRRGMAARGDGKESVGCLGLSVGPTV